MARKKKVEISQEELKQQNLCRELEDLRKREIPEPTYKFEIGQEVTIGNLEDVVIEEILDDGKIYKIDFTSTNHNYGNPIKTKHEKSYVKWVDIRKKHDNKNSFIKNNDIRINYAQTRLSEILSKVYYFGVNFEPDYQRDFVWDEDDKINLIDSIFNNVDIGKFAFILNDDFSADSLYEILDGKQRIRAILDFYEDRFKYNGCYFSDLSIRDQYHFKDYIVNIGEVSNLTKEQILKYFIKLNTGGRIMNKEQIDKVKNMLNEIEGE